MTEKPLEECPKCKGKVERVISGGAGFLFKGSGFYTTDYRSEGYKASASKEKSDVKSIAADAGKSDSKPHVDTKAKTSAKSHRSQGR